MKDIRIHRADCGGFDESINCVGCFKAYVIEMLSVCHDHMLMDPSGRGNSSRAFKLASQFLDNAKHNKSINSDKK